MQCHHSHELCVSQVPIFSHLPHHTLQLVFEKVTHRHYPKGTMLYMEGDVLDSLFVVHRGRVRIYRLNDNGEEQLLRILSHGDYTGEIALFDPSLNNTAYAEILEDADICSITREDIYHLMQQYLSISISFLEAFARRLSSSEDQTSNISLLDSRSKLLTYIQTYRHGDQLKLSLAKKHIASYLSMQPETLTRTFKKLEDENLIKRINHKTYQILEKDLEKLI